MAFLSGLGRMLGGIGARAPMAQAALAGDYSGMAAMRSRQQQFEAQQAEAQREAELEAQLRAQAAAALEARGYAKSDIGGLRPEDVSQLIREDLITRQFGPQGGSTARRDPRTNTTTYEQAPWQEQVGRSIVQGGGGRDPSVAFRGVEPVTVPDVGVFGWDDRGPVNGVQSAPQVAQPPPAPGPTAANGYAQRVGGVLASAGLPGHVVAGILGNGQHESGGRWNQAVGDNGTAFGAFQWRDERVSNFQQVTGAHPSQATPEQTAQFVLWELQNPERAGMTREQVQAIIGAPDAGQAAVAFSQHYERPNARLAHNDRRVAFANQFAGQGPALAQGGAPNMPGQPQFASDAPQPMIATGRRPPPGYQQGPGGTLSAIPGGPGDTTYQRTREAAQDARQQQQDFGGVIREFRSDPIVQQFQQARTSVLQLRSLREANRDPRNPSPAADMAMIFQYMKALDPGSTVREGEYASVRNAAGWPEQFRQLYNNAREGTLLSNRMRDDILGSASRLYTERARTYNERVEDFRRQAQAMGAEPRRIGQAFPLANAPRTADREREERQRRQQTQPRPAQDAGWLTTPSGHRFRRRRTGQ